MPKAELTLYSVVDLLSWRESGGLQISPKFQRRSVWTTSAKGHLIDSILLDYPIPPIHIRLASGTGGQTVREVIDGQQRLRAVFDFVSDSFRIPASVSAHWGGKSFSSLTDDEQDELRLFSFTVYQYKKLSDAEVLDMFSRLNTYSVSLSAQELRNGKWFGEFKRTSYGLATEALEFWRKNKIFTEPQIARMREVELTSELLIAIMDGPQDKKTSIDYFYENLDAAWGRNDVSWVLGKGSTSRNQPERYLSRAQASSRFTEVLAAIDVNLGESVRSSPLRRPALFYTLFCAVNHLIFGLPRSGDLPLAGAGLNRSVRIALRDVAGELTDLFDSKGRTRDKLMLEFYDGAARQTDNIIPRQQRLTALMKMVQRSI